MDLSPQLPSAPFLTGTLESCGVTQVFYVEAILRRTSTRVSIGILPFLTAEGVVLLLITLVPVMTMHFPRLFGFAG